MAQKVNITFVDDIDGTEAIETVRFALDGKDYEIDLSEDNAKELRSGLEKFVGAARRGSGTSTRGAGKKAGSAGSNREETQAIRLWLVDNGEKISSRGRIPSELIEKYHAAHAS